MTLDLTDEEPAAVFAELDRIIDNDRYPFSPRIRMLKEIRAKIRPEPARESWPLEKHCALPRATAARRRLRG
jgi:hypothetical protein